MQEREWRLAGDQHELAPLLERDVSGALDQRSAGAMGDRGERPHRARADHHAQCLHRPRRRLGAARSEEHTSELQSRVDLVCRLLLEKKKYHASNSAERATM